MRSVGKQAAVAAAAVAVRSADLIIWQGVHALSEHEALLLSALTATQFEAYEVGAVVNVRKLLAVVLSFAPSWSSALT